MTLSDLYRIIQLLPHSIKHVKWVKKQLLTVNYDILINSSLEKQTDKASLQVWVKSYFWASRLIYDCHCLPRSIALYQQLKAAGYEVEHKFGVNKLNKKIAAHAWVEYQDKPLNESADLKKRFTVLRNPDIKTNGS